MKKQTEAKPQHKKFVIKIYIQFEILRVYDSEFPPSFLHSVATLIRDNPSRKIYSHPKVHLRLHSNTSFI